MSRHLSSEYDSALTDSDPRYSGSGYYGHNVKVGGFSKFMTNVDVKMYWISFFSLLAYWGLLWFLRHAFANGHSHASDDDTLKRSNRRGGERHKNDTQPSNNDGFRSWTQLRGTSSVYDRLSRSSQVLGDLTIMLLSVLVLNTLSQGETRITMVLTWVYFGFAVFWSIFEAARESQIARLLFGMVFYGIILAIGSLSFVHGFHGIYD